MKWMVVLMIVRHWSNRLFRSGPERKDFFDLSKFHQCSALASAADLLFPGMETMERTN